MISKKSKFLLAEFDEIEIGAKPQLQQVFDVFKKAASSKEGKKVTGEAKDFLTEQNETRLENNIKSIDEDARKEGTYTEAEKAKADALVAGLDKLGGLKKLDLNVDDLKTLKEAFKTLSGKDDKSQDDSVKKAETLVAELQAKADKSNAPAAADSTKTR